MISKYYLYIPSYSEPVHIYIIKSLNMIINLTVIRDDLIPPDLS